MFDSGVEMRQVRLELANGELVCIGRYVRRSRLDTRETLTRLQEWNGVGERVLVACLDEATAAAPVKVAACGGPGHRTLEHARREHAASAVVGVCILDGHSMEEGRNVLLTLLQALHQRGLVGGRGRVDGVRQMGERGVEAHLGGALELGTELDFHEAGRLEHAATRTVAVGGHFDHAASIHLCVEDDPRAATQLAGRRDVHKHRLVVLGEAIDDLAALLEDLVVHVLLAAAEATPVGEHEEREALAVKVDDCLCRLVRRVRVPDLTGFKDALLVRVRIRGVRGDHALECAGFDGNDAERNAAEPRAADDDGRRPAGEGFLERAAVKEAGLERAVDDGALDQRAWVVRRRRRREDDVAVGRVVRMEGRRDAQRQAAALRHIAEPLQVGVHRL